MKPSCDSFLRPAVRVSVSLIDNKFSKGLDSKINETNAAFKEMKGEIYEAKLSNKKHNKKVFMVFNNTTHKGGSRFKDRQNLETCQAQSFQQKVSR